MDAASNNQSNSARNLSGLRRVPGVQGVPLLIILAIMWAVLAFLSPYFFTVHNLFEITLQMAVIAIIAAGETFVILSAGIDLSGGRSLCLRRSGWGPRLRKHRQPRAGHFGNPGGWRPLRLGQRSLDHEDSRPRLHRHPGHDGHCQRHRR